MPHRNVPVCATLATRRLGGRAERAPLFLKKIPRGRPTVNVEVHADQGGAPVTRLIANSTRRFAVGVLLYAVQRTVLQCNAACSTVCGSSSACSETKKKAIRARAGVRRGGDGDTGRHGRFLSDSVFFCGDRHRASLAATDYSSLKGCYRLSTAIKGY